MFVKLPFPVLIFLSCAMILGAEVKNIKIIFTGSTLGHPTKFNDENGENQGGIPARKVLFDQLIGEKSKTLLLDTGNMKGRNYTSSLFKGKPDIVGMNYIGYDAMGLGYQEINSPISEYDEMNDQADFYLVSGNIKNRNKLIADPYFIKTIDGVKIAVLSFIKEEAGSFLLKEAKKSYLITNPEEEAAIILKTLKEKERPDLIVALTNLGYDPDEKNRGVASFASLYPEIRIIIEGSSSRDSNEVFEVKGTRIYTIKKNGLYAGEIDLQYDNGIKSISETFHPINAKQNNNLIGKFIQEDKRVATTLDRLTERENEILRKTIAVVKTTEFSSKGKMEGLTKICVLAADAIRSETASDVALLNAGLFSEVDIPKNTKINYQTFKKILKYNNNTAVVNVTGRELKEIIDYAMVRKGYGEFLIFSGIQVSYSASTKEVKEIRMGGKKLLDNRKYQVALSDYLAKGGDSYNFFKNSPDLFYTDIPLLNLINDYLIKLRNITDRNLQKNSLEIID